MKKFTLLIAALTLVLIVSVSTLSALEMNSSGDTRTGSVTLNSPIIYNNTDYGFNFSLPASWQGYTVIRTTWSGAVAANANAQIGPKLLIRHPKWTQAAPYEDLPILIFTLAEWESYQKEDFSVGAAPILATELARNTTYVFALPARWDFDYSLNYEEAQDIFAARSLRAYNLVDSEPLPDENNLNEEIEPATPTETMTVTIYQLFAKLFIVYPILALLPAFILGLFYFQSRSNLIFTTILLWILYMVYEELHLLRILCSGECNIRIDLLVIYPLLIIFTLFALFVGVKNLLKSLTSP